MNWNELANVNGVSEATEVAGDGARNLSASLSRITSSRLSGVGDGCAESGGEGSKPWPDGRSRASALCSDCKLACWRVEADARRTYLHA
jgi:hypothetical protein